MSIRLDIRTRLMSGDERAFGPGKADLLERIASEGSISKAAKAMDMSYSRAWHLVDAMNAAFRKPLVVSSTGGRKGGGAVVTPLGEEVLRLYRQLQARMTAEAGAFLPALERHLK